MASKKFASHRLSRSMENLEVILETLGVTEAGVVGGHEDQDQERQQRVNVGAAVGTETPKQTQPRQLQQPQPQPQRGLASSHLGEFGFIFSFPHVFLLPSLAFLVFLTFFISIATHKSSQRTKVQKKTGE